MSSSAAQTWFVAGTVPLMLAGGLHAAAAVIDAVRPMSFTPISDSTSLAMRDSGMKFRARFPGDAATPSIWRLWLGFNISHGLGVFVFGLICLLIGTHDFDLVGQIGGLRVITIAVPAAYLATSLGFWFYAPTFVTASATACLTVSAVLAG